MENKELTQEKIKEWCLRVETWKEDGIPFGLSDLKELATELGTPIPYLDKDFNLMWD